MPYKLNKIILQRDWDWGYETYEYEPTKEIEFPPVAFSLHAN
jgi:hypothetical protein